MSVVYSEIIWLGAIVLVLMSAALVGLLKREDPRGFQPIKPLLLSPTERELLLQEKTSTIQKAMEAKKAAKRAGKIARQQLVRSRKRAAAKTDPSDVKS